MISFLKRYASFGSLKQGYIEKELRLLLYLDNSG